ncbi:MAG: hypothetical protein H0Z19_09310 [Archaeoglobus sp.]|uniref:hypothetical protein n=1 Tax=Archaeoglobus sp. TaxID=1872626 RepID=UPI001DF5A5F1|nr:hypothetical protein [Archaeoglobus sp.]MBO8180654.1 hypothetical protein [Archaeoglobus sp.]
MRREIFALMLIAGIFLVGCTANDELRERAKYQPASGNPADKEISDNESRAPTPQPVNSTQPPLPLDDLEKGKKAVLEILNRTIDVLKREGVDADAISRLESLKEEASNSASLEELRKIMEEIREIVGDERPSLPRG